MAEGILKDRLLAAGRFDVSVASMGIHGLDYKPASSNAVQVCDENGVDISSHLSRPLFPDELRSADIVFVMEPVQKEFIYTFFPAMKEKMFLLGSWPERDSSKGVVSDPIGGSIEQYRKTFRKISAHIDRILPYIFQMFPNPDFR
jgi:protein-tyrosine-phosphatase